MKIMEATTSEADDPDLACCMNVYGMACERERNKLRCNEAFSRDAPASKLSIIKHSLFYRLALLGISLT
jgi:hypothetical protein